MTCEHAACTDTATVKTRFGTGYWFHGRTRHRQTYVHYCDPHFESVDHAFQLCDTQTVNEREKPAPRAPVKARERRERDISIVVALSQGATVTDVAIQYGLTCARISQIRTHLVLG